MIGRQTQHRLVQRLPDPMEAVDAFSDVVEAYVNKPSKKYTLSSRLPDPMDAARIFRSEVIEKNQTKASENVVGFITPRGFKVIDAN
jgi:hypothetical protein